MAADHGARIDRSVLATIADPAQGGDPEFFTHLVAIFRRETPQAIADMRSAVAEGDSAELMTRAHMLKGRGGVLGAMALWSLCERLEVLGRSGDMAGATELVDQIELEAVEIQIVLDGEERRWTA